MLHDPGRVAARAPLGRRSRILLAELPDVANPERVGFFVDEVSDDHFGLQIMRERADQAGVELAIASQPDSGTSVTVCWGREQL